MADVLNPSRLLHATDELRKLILENPDLPLLVFAGEDAVGSDYRYTSCSTITAELGEMLDCQQTVEAERIFTDRTDFYEELQNRLSDSGDYDHLTDKEFDRMVTAKAAEYDRYWKPCVILYVDN